MSQTSLLSGVAAVPPLLSGSPDVDVHVYIGDPIAFTNFDVVGGDPTPTVTWYKDDVEIPTSAPSSATTADAGKYKVVAVNKAGRDEHYTRVKVTAGDFLIDGFIEFLLTAKTTIKQTASFNGLLLLVYTQCRSYWLCLCQKLVILAFK